MKRPSSFLLDYKLYLTRGWSLSETKQIVSNNDEAYDLFTGLRQKTNYGRPNFDLFFREFAANNVNVAEDDNRVRTVGVGVFFCGPEKLSHQLHRLCNLNSDERVRFFYNKENF